MSLSRYPCYKHHFQIQEAGHQITNVPVDIKIETENRYINLVFSFTNFGNARKSGILNWP